MMFGITSKISGALAAVVLAAAVAGGAQATTITVFEHSSNRAGNQADSFASNYMANTPAGATWDVDPTVTPPPGSIQGVFKSPFDQTPISGTQSYFSVGGSVNGQGAVGPTVTLTYDVAQTAITLLWGSIDTYNFIDFYSGATKVFSVDGSTVAAKIGVGLVTKRGYEEVARLGFYGFGPNGFDSIRFTATNSAFEFALPPAHAPIPAAGLMLLTALGGIAVLRRRRKA